ncbi:MAG: DUF11 domain-containing protein, partial [Candidatus Peribacteraceae bacterium]|nr:DUF11 domain-containing protein [Candidatus Peribacteraceae bacterium]
YEVEIENIGQVTLGGIWVIDTIPTGLTFDSGASDSRCFQQGNDVKCGDDDIDPGDSDIYVIVFTIDNNIQCGSTIENDAYVVFMANGNINGYTNTVDTYVDCPDAELDVTKEANRSTADIGDIIIYTLTVENISNFDADDTEIIDVLPDDVIFVSANAGGTYDSGTHTVLWEIDIDAGDTETLTVTVEVSIHVNDNDILYNEVCIINGDCADDTTRVVVDDPTFSITKTDHRSTVEPGETLIYEIEVTNTSNVDAIDIVVTDSVPNDTTFDYADNGGSKSGNTVTWTFDLDASDSIILTMEVTVDSSADDGDVIRNTACIDRGDCDTDTTTIDEDDVGSCGDLTISIEADDDEIEPGDEVEFEITVRNPTSNDIDNVDITLSLGGVDVKIERVSDNGDEDGDDRVDWDDLDIPANSSKKLTVQVEVDNDADDGDEIRATARSCDDSDSVEVDIEDDDDDEDIRVSINDDPDPVDVCNDDDLEYEIRLTNSSNSNEKVDVIAQLDSNTEYRSSSDGGKERGSSRVEWDNVKVSRNSNRTIRLRVRVEGDTRDGDTLRLRVAVSDGDEDTEVTRVRNRGCGDPETPSDLTIDKTSDRTEAFAGSLVSYTITIRNTGNQDLPNATLTDDYLENMVTISDPGGGSDAGGRLTWNLGTLRGNTTTVVRYRVRVKDSISFGASIRNIATVKSGSLTRSDEHTVVVPRPPQTGLGGFLKSLTRNDDDLSPSDDEKPAKKQKVASKHEIEKREPKIITIDERDRAAEQAAANLPVIVWMTTMLTGLGIGGLFGKKFLF